MTVAAAEVERTTDALPPPPLHRQPLFVRFWAARSVSVFGVRSGRSSRPSHASRVDCSRPPLTRAHAAKPAIA